MAKARVFRKNHSWNRTLTAKNYADFTAKVQVFYEAGQASFLWSLVRW
jgi:hypothetical protein